jgi:hypothetical protein
MPGTAKPYPGMWLLENMIHRRGAEMQRNLQVFVGAALAANNSSDCDEFAAKACAERSRSAAPTNNPEFSAPLRFNYPLN